jgi:transcriptional regulator with XRE-family HTH domain
MARVTRLKVLLAERGETQRAFAEKMGVTPGVMAHVANGRVAIWPALRTRIVAELGEDPFSCERLVDPVDGLLEAAVAQGLSAVVTDPDVIRRISTIIRTAGAA